MPSITTNPNNKAKKKNLDISQLKAPTPSVEIAIEDAQQPQIAHSESKSLLKKLRFHEFFKITI